VQLVNRRTDTKLEEDLELLNALCALLCHATVRAVQLKDAFVIDSLPPLTQVEFFGETSIIPDKSQRRATSATFPVMVSPGSEPRLSWPSSSPDPAGLDDTLNRHGSGSRDTAASLDSLPEPTQNAAMRAARSTDRPVRISGGSTSSDIVPGLRHLWTDVARNLSPGSRSGSPLGQPGLSAMADAAQREAQLEQETGEPQKIDCIDGDDFPLQVRAGGSAAHRLSAR